MQETKRHLRPHACEWLPLRASSDHACSHPAVHESHAVFPSSAWNVPAAHLVHMACCGWSLYVPGAQGAASAEPTGQNVPTGQTMQSLSESITSRLASLRLPAGHGNAAAAPSAQKSTHNAKNERA